MLPFYFVCKKHLNQVAPSKILAFNKFSVELFNNKKRTIFAYSQQRVTVQFANFFPSKNAIRVNACLSIFYMHVCSSKFCYTIYFVVISQLKFIANHIVHGELDQNDAWQSK